MENDKNFSQSEIKTDLKAFRSEAQKLELTLDEENPVKGGHNPVFALKDQFGRAWVGKEAETAVFIYDSLEREALASELAAEFGVPIPKTAKIIFQGREVILSERIKGKTFRQVKEEGNLDEITDKKQILNIMVFSHWLGDQDRHLENILADQDGKTWSIDYGLSGPGGLNAIEHNIYWSTTFEDYKSIGTGGGAPDYSVVHFLERSLNHVFSMEDFEDIIERIENISEERIKEIVSGYNLYKELTYARINSEFAAELIRRKENLRAVFKDFVEWKNNEKI